MKKTIIFKNSFVGLVTQISVMLFQFVTRRVLLQYLGIEVLGLSSTFVSILSTLSLAELGFENAIIYSLYKPLNDNNQDRINDIMNIYKVIYRIVALVILLLSLCCVPLIPKLITGMKITSFVYVVFGLQATNTIASYLLAYKRALLYADQKDYITKTVDLIINIICNCVEIYVIAKFKSYYLYLVICIIQTIAANSIIHLFCNRFYPFLKKNKLNHQLFREIVAYVKQIIISKIAGYVYGSTDNIIISAMVNTVVVGQLVNYTTITKSVRRLIEGFLKPLNPIIGRTINENERGDEETLFLMYSHVRYLIACMVIIPLYLLIDDFIAMWVGQEYILPKLISVLICAEMYIYLVHGGVVAFINGKGLFKYEKNVEIIGAATNIIGSVGLVSVMGLPGVLLATVIAQMFYWIGRSIVFYKFIVPQKSTRFLNYWVSNFWYLLVFILEGLVAAALVSCIAIKNPVIEFIAKGFTCELVIAGMSFLAFIRNPSQKRILNTIWKK